MRLDTALTKHWPEYSRSTLQKFIKQSRVKVNGIPTLNLSKEISDSDRLELNLPMEAIFTKEQEDFSKNVIYEDNNVIVIDKPIGVLTHSKGVLADEFTVADFIKFHIDNEYQEFLNTNRPGIVHRLDRATSGVLIAAKNPETQRFLQKQFADRKAHKTYIAIVEKAPKLDTAKIDLPIGRNPSKPSSFRIDAKGKSAITNYTILKHFRDGSSLIELKPLTGRTHQLRVHLSYIGSPILGDPIYSFSKKSTARMFLHAYELEITIPGKNQNVRKTFRAQMPADFNDKISSLEKI